jgi:hypothetical protein
LVVRSWIRMMRSLKPPLLLLHDLRRRIALALRKILMRRRHLTASLPRLSPRPRKQTMKLTAITQSLSQKRRLQWYPTMI